MQYKIANNKSETIINLRKNERKKLYVLVCLSFLSILASGSWPPAECLTQAPLSSGFQTGSAREKSHIVISVYNKRSKSRRGWDIDSTFPLTPATSPWNFWQQPCSLTFGHSSCLVTSPDMAMALLKSHVYWVPVGVDKAESLSSIVGSL